jgi:hypothetical protein
MDVQGVKCFTHCSSSSFAFFSIQTASPASIYEHSFLGACTGRLFLWTWRDNFFSNAPTATLKQPCKSELFHLRSVYVMVKWMFLILGDGTVKHVSAPPLSPNTINRVYALTWDWWKLEWFRSILPSTCYSNVWAKLCHFKAISTRFPRPLFTAKRLLNECGDWGFPNPAFNSRQMTIWKMVRCWSKKKEGKKVNGRTPTIWQLSRKQFVIHPNTKENKKKLWTSWETFFFSFSYETSMSKKVLKIFVNLNSKNLKSDVEIFESFLNVRKKKTFEIFQEKNGFPATMTKPFDIKKSCCW